jgi:isopentenyl diphosphate isomerase/L-lactate dehydrogenase-like FMN-dependent dehydrogenase
MNPVNVEDYRRRARRRLPRMVFEFIEGGAEDEHSLRANRRGWEEITFRPRVLTDVSKIRHRTTVAGHELEIPVILAPTGLSRLAGPEGEHAAAAAAHACGTVSVMSTSASVSLEDAARRAPSAQWFQLYPWADRAVTTSLIERARRAGYSLMMVTVDVPAAGGRERDQRVGMTVPPRVATDTVLDVARHPRWAWQLLRGPQITFANMVEEFPHLGSGASTLAQQSTAMMNPANVWADLAWMREAWGGPMMLKGITTAEDARRAVDAGVDGLVVSNHGGRQLDCLPATARVLPEVVAAVDGAIDIVVDGGIRRGSDIVKALGLGAKAVMVGRPWLWALASGGSSAVVEMLRMLTVELDRNLALVGCPDVADLDRSSLRLAADDRPVGPTR